jgi:hypothetical protein
MALRAVALLLVVLVVLVAGACKGRGAPAPPAGESQALPSVVARVTGFEGEIVLEHVPAAGGQPTTTIKMKGDRVRTARPGGAVLLDLTKGKAYFLDAATKTYEEYEVPTADAGATTPLRTGKRDRVAGFECDIVTRTSGPDTLEECVSPDIAAPAALALGASPALKNEGGFPLRSIVRDAAGKERSRTTAVHIEKKPIPDRDLAVPPDYARVPSAP